MAILNKHGYSFTEKSHPERPNRGLVTLIKKGANTSMKEDNMRDLAIHDIEAQLGKINDEITFLQIDQKDKESALAALGELRSVLDKYQSQKESAVREDDRVEKAMKDMQPSKVTGYYEITDFWKEHTQMWGKDPETVKYEIADWMVDEIKPDNTPEREELTKRAWAIVDDALKNNKDDMTFDDMIDQLKGKKESTKSSQPAPQPVNSSVDDTIQRARAQIESLEVALKEHIKKFQA